MGGMKAVTTDKIFERRKAPFAPLLRSLNPKCASGDHGRVRNWPVLVITTCAGHHHQRRATCLLRVSNLKSNSHFSLAVPKVANVWTSSFFRTSHKASRAVSHKASTDTAVVSGDDSDTDLAQKTTWNLKGLKNETGRQVMRQWKKVSQADQRVKRRNTQFKSKFGPYTSPRSSPMSATLNTTTCRTRLSSRSVTD
eukprot:9085847-Pyramimonas_sp.AAC.1